MLKTTCTLLLVVALAAAGGALGAETPGGPDRPNFLIVIGDDATCSDLPLYGGRNVRTPRIDRLASQGMMFTHAYVGMSMCLPCRTEMYTGLYPMRSGACWNHSAARPGTKSIVHYLGELGYRVGIAGKVHVVPRDSFPFEMVDGFERDCVAPTADHECSGIRRFMARDPDQPFCLVVGLVVPHVVWTVGDPSHFDPAKLKLPPHFADTPQTREDFAKYLAEIEVLDQQVGDVLRTLDETGQAERTLVLFTSEQGAQFPGCKWTNWEQGLHTGLMVRWPGRVQPGSRTDALVQYADVLPTLLEAAGCDPAPMNLDGSSFLPVLLGKATEHRRYVYAMHNNIPEGPAYPIRSVRDRHHRYIRNLSPEATYIEKHVMAVAEHNPYWSTWVFATWSDPHAYAMVHRYMHRPAEELYRTSDDPFEMQNLAGDPQCAEVKARLAAELDRWMEQQGDPGAALDTQEAWTARRREAGIGIQKPAAKKPKKNR
jgi:N-sulfoglucosamine sulfohydrolase